MPTAQKVVPRTYFPPSEGRRAFRRGLGQGNTGAEMGIAAASMGLNFLLPGAGALLTPLAGLFQPDLKKIQASNDANEVANQMTQNLSAWYALKPSQKTTEVQAYFINNYDQLWNALEQLCSNPQLGSAGQNCLSDRERGGKYPFPVYFLDPIVNDPAVHQSANATVIQDPNTGVITQIPGAPSAVSAVASQGVAVAAAHPFLLLGGLAALLFLL